nr:hypothetical protein DA06_07895 [Georgenia sp. SUBG003]
MTSVDQARAPGEHSPEVEQIARLHPPFAAEQVRDVVGEHEGGVDLRAHLRPVPQGGDELVGGVDRVGLDAGELPEPSGGGAPAGQEVRDARGAGVAVGVHRRGEGAVGADQGVVDAPGVDGDAGDLLAVQGGGQAVTHLGDDARDVPDERTRVVLGVQGEAVGLVEAHGGAVVPAQHHATGAGPEVHRRDRRRRSHPSLLSSSSSQNGPRPRARAGGERPGGVRKPRPRVRLPLCGARRRPGHRRPGRRRGAHWYSARAISSSSMLVESYQ